MALVDTQHDAEVLAAVPYTLDPMRSSTMAQQSPAVRHVLRMRQLAGKLLLAVNACVYFWPQHWDRDAVAAPALRLCVVTMQHCSRCADLITPTASGAAALGPTAPGKLTATAFMVGQAVFTAWDTERLGEDDADISALEGPDAMRAVCAMLMVPLICPQQYFKASQQLLDNLEARMKNAVKLRYSTAANNSDSVEAWQFACAHDSQVSDIQQQVLQALGCSSRLFMYMAGTALTPLMNANTILGMANVYLMLAKHRVPLSNLDRPAEVRKLAASLQEHQEGAAPPGTSPLLPCAPLLWLTPAALLQWAGKQPARGAHLAYQNYMLSTVFWPAIEHVLEQHDWWADAEHKFYNAAGGDAGRQEQQQAMLNAMRALAMGSGWALIVPASHQNLTPEQSSWANSDRKLYQAVSEAADECRKAWAPPAVCFAQLLQQAGGAAVGMLACIMQAQADADPAGSSSGSSSRSGSSGTRSNPVSAKPSSSSKGRSSRKSRSKYGDVAPVSSDTDAVILSRALLRLCQGSVALLNLSYGLLWYFVNKARLAARRNPVVGMERYGLIPDPNRVGVDPGQLDEEEQTNLAALCAALQEAAPQLASLADAAMLTSAQELETEGQYTQLAIESNFLYAASTAAVQVPGVFVAAGLQPGSPALKPLASLTATLLKVVAAAQENPEEPRNVAVAALALSNTLSFNSIVLEVACSGGTGGNGGGNGGAGRRPGRSSGGRGWGSSSVGSSGSSRCCSPDAVIDVLTGSRAVTDTGNRWSAGHLSVISNASELSCNNSSSTSGTGGSSGNDGGSGSVGAVAMMPGLLAWAAAVWGTLGPCGWWEELEREQQLWEGTICRRCWKA